MSDIEELKRKKEYLELQKEIAALEKSARIHKAFNFLSYKITVPLLLLGLFNLILGAKEQALESIVLGLILITPFMLKFFSRK
ncbi:hypothetical protein LX59_02259 [Azomonas agilis]|uniref:Uncharacterized protein n=1 Tax=Azomonas agilis TaxID=116849 RepID=A0A562I0L3_9GAMM|nr:hypothetical protein [Azomonas agilis]TWH64589.1 hypothetical protein LX59_02259 [Azomonas agilis]